LDYRSLEATSHSARVAFEAARDGTAHGLLLWFECELADGIAFSTGPDQPPRIYGVSMLPLSAPVGVAAGDAIEVDLRADFTGADYFWSWETQVRGPGGPKASFRQSNFFA